MDRSNIYYGMEPASYPTPAEIRTALIERAGQFIKLTDTPKSTIGKNAVNDPAFISQVEAGRNFTVGMYERVMTWLDDNWPKDDQRKAS